MRTPRAVALAVVLALAAVGCGDDDDPAVDEAGDGTTTSTTTTVETATTTTTTTTSVPDDEGIAAIEELAQGLLITVEELGAPGFENIGYTPFEGPNECGVDVDADFPPDAVAGTVLSDGTHSFQQEIRVYADATRAAIGFDARVNAFRCGTGSQGTTYTDPVDINDRIVADAAFVVTASSPQIQGQLVTALVADAVVSFVFSAPPGADTSALPDPVEVAAFGVGKILAALEN